MYDEEKEPIDKPRCSGNEALSAGNRSKYSTSCIPKSKPKGTFLVYL